AVFSDLAVFGILFVHGRISPGGAPSLGRGIDTDARWDLSFDDNHVLLADPVSGSLVGLFAAGAGAGIEEATVATVAGDWRSPRVVIGRSAARQSSPDKEFNDLARGAGGSRGGANSRRALDSRRGQGNNPSGLTDGYGAANSTFDNS